MCDNSLLFISEDEDEGDGTPAEAAKSELICRRKPRRLVERKNADAEAKDNVMSPSEPLLDNHKLSKHHDFLAVMIFLMDLEEMMQ